MLAIKGPGPVRAKTDAQGRFEFDAPDMTTTDLDGLPTRRGCLVIAAAHGYATEWIQCRGRTRSQFILEPVPGIDLALKLATGDVPIRGRLLDPLGQPLAGARVELTGLTIPRGHDLDDYLEHNKSIGMFGKPIRGRYLTRVQLLPGVKIETQTDADGRFTLAGLGRDRIGNLKITAPSVVDTWIQVMTREGTDFHPVDPRRPGAFVRLIHAADFTLKLEPGRTIQGLVRDRDTHQPIAGMWVGPRNAPWDGLVSGTYPWVTDERGRFTITGLYLNDGTRDPLKLSAVSLPGMTYDAGVVQVPNDEGAEVVIELSARHSVSPESAGRARPAGRGRSHVLRRPAEPTGGWFRVGRRPLAGRPGRRSRQRNLRRLRPTRTRRRFGENARPLGPATGPRRSQGIFRSGPEQLDSSGANLRVR